MTLREKLGAIQSELKAPKGQFNSFGKYKYRSCEDILEAVKPLLKKHNCLLTITDDVVMMGDRFYIKATATICGFENDGEIIRNTALAREEVEKKGQDASQITGTASSYARKYCLNGLFLIDDTKDADTDEFQKTTNGSNDKISDIQLKSIKETIKKNPDLLSEQGLCKKFGIKTLKDMTLLNLREVIEYLDKQKSEAKDDKK